MKDYAAEYRVINNLRYQNKKYWSQKRKCIKCSVNKLYSQFSKSRASASGILTICKICDNEKRKLYEQENAEKVLIRNRIYRNKNIVHIKEYRHNRHEALKDNREYRAQRRKIRNQRRTKKKFTHLTYTNKQLVARLSMARGICYLCGYEYDLENYHLDHVKPISKGGYDMLANFRPVHPECNLKKRDKWFGAHRLGELI